MNRRLLGNILLITLVLLAGTGVVMYFTPFDKRIASLHTIIALVFIIAIGLHIANNKRPLSDYISGKRQRGMTKWQALLILMAFIALSVFTYMGIPAFNAVYDWGNELRNSQLGKKEVSQDYQIISLNDAQGDRPISVELKKGNAFQYPLFAIWQEGIDGSYEKTLYISRVISSSTFDYGKQVGDEWEAAQLRRPEALPYWSHKRGIQAEDGLYIPLGDAPDLDGVSGATPTDNFIIHSNAKSTMKDDSYVILIEVNQSYDWNDYYTEDKYPDDPIYSGSGQVGQPSLIYAATID